MQRLNPKPEILFEYKQEIIDKLEANGIKFEADRDKLLERAVRRKTSSEPLRERFYDFIRSNWFPKAAIPALVVATAIILLIVLPKSPNPDNPYYKYLSFEKASYLSLVDTRVLKTDAQRLFHKGM